MKNNQVEMIQLRTTGYHERKRAVDTCMKIIELAPQSPSKQVRLFSNAAYDTDLCVWIYWKDAKSISDKSTLGELIIKGLRGYGIVHHSIWVSCANTKK